MKAAFKHADDKNHTHEDIQYSNEIVSCIAVIVNAAKKGGFSDACLMSSLSSLFFNMALQTVKSDRDQLINVLNDMANMLKDSLEW